MPTQNTQVAKIPVCSKDPILLGSHLCVNKTHQVYLNLFQRAMTRPLQLKEQQRRLTVYVNSVIA